MKGARDQDEGGPQYGTTLLKSRAPKTLKFLDPAYAKTTVDLAEEKEQANEKVNFTFINLFSCLVYCLYLFDFRWMKRMQNYWLRHTQQY